MQSPRKPRKPRLSPRLNINPVTAITIVALAAMFFMSRSVLALDFEKEKIEVTPQSAPRLEVSKKIEPPPNDSSGNSP
jgi:hypothetical protein